VPDEHRRAQVDASVAQRGIGAEKKPPTWHKFPFQNEWIQYEFRFFRGYLMMIGGIDQAKYGLNQFFVWVFVIQRPSGGHRLIGDFVGSAFFPRSLDISWGERRLHS